MAERRDRRDFTREEAGEFLSYDPETGIFTWKIEANSFGGKIYPGDVAGGHKDGYIQIKLFGRYYRAHHLAWLFMTGEWPPIGSDIDHRSRDRAHNAWRNLRLATRTQNNMNMGLRSDNKSGHPGVSLIAKTGKWDARIKLDGRVILLGAHVTKEAAVAARQEAERKHFGEFRRQG